MAKLLIALIGPDGRTVLAEPGGEAYQRLVGNGFVDTTKQKSPLAESLLEGAGEAVDSASELSELVQDDTGTVKVLKKRGRKAKSEIEE